jgi:beta-lactamase superfamily II metal-dependent hydrolase
VAWELEITTIDVGQGESSLIIAQDVDGGGGSRSMLIDGGLPGRAQFAQQVVYARLLARGLDRVDHIVVSHYDKDHSGGVLSLLKADNLWRVFEIMAQPALDAYAEARKNASVDDAHRLAAAVAAAAAAATGDYELDPTHDYRGVALKAGKAAETMLDATPERAAMFGRDYARKRDGNPAILQTADQVKQAAIAAGTAAVPTPKRPNPTAAYVTWKIQKAGRGLLENPVDTMGFYRRVNVIDIGENSHMATEYPELINGRVIIKGGGSTYPPGTERRRTSVNCHNNGNELLWHRVKPPVKAPAGAPAAFLMANNKYTWNAPRDTNPISGTPDNAVSIALVIRFNNFFFYTGGDLPCQGENLVATAIMTRGLPNPQDPKKPFPIPDRVAALKAGHHGSPHSTSAAFLTTLKPRAAFVSCGVGDEKNPSQNVVDRLEARINTGKLADNMELFYFTNCNYPRTYVAMSNFANQLGPTSHSRVSGDSEMENAAVGRQRGNIRLDINLEESQAVPPDRQFHVQYYEFRTDPLSGFAVPLGLRSEKHPF